MGLGTSIFLIAVGAILDFAVNVNVQGFNIHNVGVILMVVGIIGAILSMVFWSSWGGFNRSRRTVAYDSYDAPVAPVRRRVIEEDRTF
ncbi:MAG TPA: DUF6458 family protein [Actinomycetota bacterium]|nr:DUF6458 family protein [Actinomycetota bacterium]